MRILKIVCFTLLFVFCFSFVQAQTVTTVDLEKLSSIARNEILNKSGKKVENKVKNIKEWAGIGKEIGIAISETCKVLNVEVNNFVKSPVGKITLFIILWKIVGARLLLLLLLLLFLIPISWSYKRFFFGYRVKSKEGHISYEGKYEFSTDEARCMSAIVHTILFIAVLGGIILTLI